MGRRRRPRDAGILFRVLGAHWGLTSSLFFTLELESEIVEMLCVMF